jgi:hypothetical protein
VQASTGAPDQWVPRDCRPELPGWPDRPTDVIVATTPPQASSSFPRQTLDAVRSRGLRIRVRSNEAGRVRAQLVRRGRVLRTITRALRANVRRELVLTLPAVTRRALRNAGSATFSVRLRVTDAAGNVRVLSRAVVLRAASMSSTEEEQAVAVFSKWASAVGQPARSRHLSLTGSPSTIRTR